MPDTWDLGGINVIYRLVMELLSSGVQVAIVSTVKTNSDDLYWHPIRPMTNHPNFLWLDFSTVAGHNFDIAVCTWWRSFFDLWKIQAKAYVYFVQSIESRFYSMSERVIRAAVEATYDAPIGFITEATWISQYLGKMHGQIVPIAPNGIDKCIFFGHGEADAPRSRGQLRVLVEGAVDVGFKNVPASIRLAREGGADEIWLLTPSKIEQYPGVDRVFSGVAQERTGAIYRACDVVVKLSLVEGMFGPPLEMFHCGGTAIVYDVTGHDEYIKHGYNALVAKMNDEAMVRRLVSQLKASPNLLDGLKKNALVTAAAWPDWRASTHRFLEALIEAAKQSRSTNQELGRFSRQIWHFVESHWRDMAEQRGGGVTTEPGIALYGNTAEWATIRVLEEQIAMMRSSTSWRLTRPIRGLKRMATEPGFSRLVASVLLKRLLRR